MNRTQPRKRRVRGRTAGPLGLIVLVVVAGLTWIGVTGGENDSSTTGTAQSATSTAPPTQPAPPTPTPASPELRGPTAQLDALAVKGRAPKTGYKRAEFGQAWTDDVNVPEGHNGCDTRNDILRRDLTAITVKPGTRDCVVLTGVLDDPYSGRIVEFLRGEKTSPAVQIDHVVALSDAWQKGAAQWGEAKRTDFANDPDNLQATDGPTNQKKGAGDTATWLPPNKAYRCTYVTRQIDIKARYGLWITSAERDAMAGTLATC